MANAIGAFPFIAGGAITKFAVVELSGTAREVTETNAANDAALGVVEEEVTAADATNERVVNVVTEGIVTCIASEAIVAHVRVRATSDGKVADLAAAAKQNVFGWALTDAVADGDHIKVLIDKQQIDNS